MLADLIDAVVGVDTHRDTHQVEIALPNGAPIAVTTISNDTTGYTQLLARIVEHAPGPRVVVSIEGTRSYGVGLARAAAAAGLVVLECEQPHRKARRASDAAGLVGPHGDLDAVSGAEFSHEAGEVGLDGARGDVQLAGDLIVGAALGYRHEDFLLAGGERFYRLPRW